MERAGDHKVDGSWVDREPGVRVSPGQLPVSA